MWLNLQLDHPLNKPSDPFIHTALSLRGQFGFHCVCVCVCVNLIDITSQAWWIILPHMLDRINLHRPSACLAGQQTQQDSFVNMWWTKGSAVCGEELTVLLQKAASAVQSYSSFNVKSILQCTWLMLPEAWLPALWPLHLCYHRTETLKLYRIIIIFQAQISGQSSDQNTIVTVWCHLKHPIGCTVQSSG